MSPEGVERYLVRNNRQLEHAGRISPYALFPYLRENLDVPIIAAGCISTGRQIVASLALGAELVYMGTRFINTKESGAVEGYQQMIIEATATDIFYGTLTDAPSNVLTPCLIRAGVTPEQIRRQDEAAILAVAERRKRWKDIWSAGHGVGVIHDVLSVEVLCDRLKAEYAAAKSDLGRLQAAE